MASTSFPTLFLFDDCQPMSDFLQRETELNQCQESEACRVFLDVWPLIRVRRGLRHLARLVTG